MSNRNFPDRTGAAKNSLPLRHQLFDWHRQKLSLEDWYFKDCPDEQLGYCLNYEIHREWLPVRRRAEGWKRAGGTIKRGDTESIQLYIDPFLELFPETPWLAIPSEKRGKWVKQWHTNSYFGILGITSPEHLKKDGKLCTFVTERSKDSVQSYLAFRINWAWNDSRLIHLFEDWLKDNRPQGATPRERRGKRSLRPRLKALGARRLLLACGSIPKAEAFAQGQGKKCPYAKGRWEREAHEVEDLIRNW
jgi:hypothetical protein